MKIQTRICDMCKKRVAETNCALCRKDLCGEQYNPYCCKYLYIFTGFAIPVCNVCNKNMPWSDNKIETYKLIENFPKIKEMTREIIDWINTNKLIKNLKDGD